MTILPLLVYHRSSRWYWHCSIAFILHTQQIHAQLFLRPLHKVLVKFTPLSCIFPGTRRIKEIVGYLKHMERSIFRHRWIMGVRGMKADAIGNLIPRLGVNWFKTCTPLGDKRQKNRRKCIPHCHCYNKHVYVHFIYFRHLQQFFTFPTLLARMRRRSC